MPVGMPVGVLRPCRFGRARRPSASRLRRGDEGGRDEEEVLVLVLKLGDRPARGGQAASVAAAWRSPSASRTRPASCHSSCRAARVNGGATGASAATAPPREPPHPGRNRRPGHMPLAASAAIASPARAPNTAPSSSELDAESVRAVHAGAGDLAHRIEARQGRSAVEVGRHSAHEVVRGRGHRNGRVRPVEPALAHGGVDRREAPRRKAAVLRVSRAVASRSTGRPSCSAITSAIARATTSRARVRRRGGSRA
jgi:hypothetical protein